MGGTVGERDVTRSCALLDRELAGLLADLAESPDFAAAESLLLKQFSEELERPVPQISDGAMSLLMHHDWPGNVRELQNAVHRAVILASDNVIRQGHLANILDAAPRPDLDVPRTSDDLKRVKKIAREKSVEDIEKLFLHETLKRNVWNVTRSAEETGMQRANFQALMKKHNALARRLRDRQECNDVVEILAWH